MPAIVLTLANSSGNLLMLMIEPEGADYWLSPGEEVELRAGSKKKGGRFVVQYCDDHIAILPWDVRSITVFQDGAKLKCGHKRPKKKA